MATILSRKGGGSGGSGGPPSGAAGGVLGGSYPNPGFAADMATQAELDAHINDATAAHAATAVAFTPAGTIAANTVQAAIEEVASEGGSLPAWWTVDSTPGSESVIFGGTISATGNYVDRASYSGNIVDVPDGGAATPLTFDSLGSGPALLDITAPTDPTVVEAGIYSVTAVVQLSEALTAGGGFQAELHLDLNDVDFVCEGTGSGPLVNGMILLSLNNTVYIPAGGEINVLVRSYDGAAARDFNLREVLVQRIL